MRRVLMFLALLLVPFILAACGGGGGTGSGGGGGNDDGSKKITVVTDQPTTAQIGQATIELPQGCFGGQAEIIATQTKAPKIPQPAFKAAQPVLTLDCSTSPTSPFTISYPDVSGGIPVAIALDGTTPIGVFPAERIGSRIVVTIDQALEASFTPLSRGKSSTISIVMGLATLLNSPDSSYGLKEIPVSGTRDRTVIFVHGLMQTADSVVSGLKEYQKLVNFKHAYSFRYDYRKPIAEVGAELARAIKVANFPEKSVDIIGYSKGGLATLWALTQCGETRAVRRVMFMAAPIQGCNMGLTALYCLFGEVFSLSTEAIPFVDCKDNCILELVPGSDALVPLQTYHYNQKGDVDYYLFAGDSDRVVSTGSAQASGLQLKNFTSGRVMRTSLPGFGHTSMDDPAAIEAAYRSVEEPEGGLEVSFNPDPAELLEEGSWLSDVVITNHTNQTVRLLSVKFEEYNRHGVWQGDYWLDPDCDDGEFFPHLSVDLAKFGYSIGSEASTSFCIGYWPDESKTPVFQAPPAEQARTSRVICQAVGQDGTSYKNSSILTMGYNGITPEPPDTRSPKGQPASRVGIAIRKK